MSAFHVDGETDHKENDAESLQPCRIRRWRVLDRHDPLSQFVEVGIRVLRLVDDRFHAREAVQPPDSGVPDHDDRLQRIVLIHRQHS
jgi:hypothetical protein